MFAMTHPRRPLNTRHVHGPAQPVVPAVAGMPVPGRHGEFFKFQTLVPTEKVSC